MKKNRMANAAKGGGAFALNFLLLIGLTLSPPSVIRAQAENWEKVLSEAEREGKVSVWGPPGDTYRTALVEEFQKKYPKISVEWFGASGRDSTARVVRERQSGLFNWDLYIGGAGTPMRVLKPTGAFVPVRQEILLPEVLDDRNWHGGFDAGFADKEGKFIFGFDATAVEIVYVNWDYVPAEAIKSSRDIIDPKWAGKIVWEDPRQEGSGLTAGLLFQLFHGNEFLKKLFTEQKIVFTLDRRQLVEWNVRGRYPIAIGSPTGLLEIFQEKGLGKNIRPLDESGTMDAYSYAFGTVAVFDRRPHPNAANVYLNWLLSKSGQTSWVTHMARRNSRRLDVAPSTPELALKPNRKYLSVQAETVVPKRLAVVKLAKELIRQ